MKARCQLRCELPVAAKPTLHSLRPGGAVCQNTVLKDDVLPAIYWRTGIGSSATSCGTSIVWNTRIAVLINDRAILAAPAERGIGGWGEECGLRCLLPLLLALLILFLVLVPPHVSELHPLLALDDSLVGLRLGLDQHFLQHVLTVALCVCPCNLTGLLWGGCASGE